MNGTFAWFDRCEQDNGVKRYVTRQGNLCERYEARMRRISKISTITAKNLESFLAEIADGSELTGWVHLKYEGKGGTKVTWEKATERFLKIHEITLKDGLIFARKNSGIIDQVSINVLQKEGNQGVDAVLSSAFISRLRVTKPNHDTWKVIIKAAQLIRIRCFTQKIDKNNFLLPSLYRLSALTELLVYDVRVTSKTSELKFMKAVETVQTLKFLDWKQSYLANVKTIEFKCILSADIELNGFSRLVNLFQPSHEVRVSFTLKYRYEVLFFQAALNSVFNELESLESLSLDEHFFRLSESFRIENKINF